MMWKETVIRIQVWVLSLTFSKNQQQAESDAAAEASINKPGTHRIY